MRRPFGVGIVLCGVFALSLTCEAAYRADRVLWRAPYAAPKVYCTSAAKPDDTDVFVPTNRIGGLILVEARVRGRGVGRGPHHYNGPKVMLAYTSCGRKFYPQLAADFGTFGPTVWKMVYRLPDDVQRLKVVVGLEAAPGELTVESVTISSAVETSEDRSALKPSPPDPTLPRGRWTNGHNPTALRGVMSGDDLSDPALDELVRWNANLMRYQIRISQRDCERMSDYFAALERELVRAHDVLDRCAARGIRVVIDLHSGPGCRQTKVLSNEVPENYDASDLRRAWRTIATRFRAHPAVWAYDILNEPHVTPKTWDRVFRETMAEIREVDGRTPCVTEFPDFWYGDEKVIYSPHVYAPLELTHFGVGGIGTVRWDYPGEIDGRVWDRERLRRSLAPWIRLQAAHPEARIFVGEFSCILWTRGADRYLADAISLFEEYGWDWTYHAFREWGGWSVEMAPDAQLTPGVMRKAAGETPRKRALLRGLSFNKRNGEKMKVKSSAIGVCAVAATALVAQGAKLDPVELVEKPNGSVALRVTLAAENGESAKGWTLLTAPKRAVRFQELRPESTFESPYGSGKAVAAQACGKPTVSGKVATWEIPVKHDADFTDVSVFRAWKDGCGTLPIEASVARLAKRKGNGRLLRRAEKAFWAQGSEPIPCNESLRVGNERVYRLKQTGTEVFEVGVKAVSPLERRVRILAWGDNHFKMADEADRANANIAAAFEKRGTCNPPELTTQSAQREVEMSPYFDKTVVLGDFIDFFSTGSLSLWKSTVLDPVGPDLLTVIGAHDVRTDFINRRPYMEMPPEKTLPTVSKFLPNDPYYASELIGEKVLAVCIWTDWGWFVSYWNIAEKLKADLERARKNGWTVVVFGHDGFYPNTWTKGADGKYDRAADKQACLMKGFCLSGDNAKKQESYADRGDYLTGAKDRGEHIRKGTKAFYDVLCSGGDVIRGIFQGHVHANYCMRVHARTPDGTPVDIPQYSCRGSAFCPDGFVFVINIE